MGKKMYRPRFIQKWYANIAGYFWLPCPLCGTKFGGHEWRRWNHAGMPKVGFESTSEGVCDDCAPIGKAMWILMEHIYKKFNDMKTKKG